MSTPYFSIVMPHYHHTIPHERFIRAIDSIKSQSFRDWELLIYHDGPVTDFKLIEYTKKITNDSRIKFFSTEQRIGDWGHSLRDIGIRNSAGVYIMNTNSDNVLYQNTLAILYADSKWKKETIKYKSQGDDTIKEFVINPDCLVFGVKMFGMLNYSNTRSMMRFINHEDRFQTILTGWPPNKYSIDAMQLVAKREIWENIGYWYLKHEESDGDIIQKVTTTFGYLTIPEVLGEHW